MGKTAAELLRDDQRLRARAMSAASEALREIGGFADQESMRLAHDVAFYAAGIARHYYTSHTQGINMIKSALNPSDISVDIYEFLKGQHGMVVGDPSTGTTAIDAEVDLKILAAYVLERIKLREGAES